MCASLLQVFQIPSAGLDELYVGICKANTLAGSPAWQDSKTHTEVCLDVLLLLVYLQIPIEQAIADDIACQCIQAHDQVQLSLHTKWSSAITCCYNVAATLH